MTTPKDERATRELPDNAAHQALIAHTVAMLEKYPPLDSQGADGECDQ